MITIDYTGTREQIIGELVKIRKTIISDHKKASESINHLPKREVRDYEAMVLYILATQYNKPGARILEIGTAWGYTAAVMACAAPKAQIVTLTPNPNHAKIAAGNLKQYPGVIVLDTTSQEYLAGYNGLPLDMIFVDGDHKRIVEDMPWWNYVRPGGLFFHHDYSEINSTRPCRPVFDTLNKFIETDGPPDVRVIDDTGVGVLGWYRKKGDAPWDC